MTCANDSHLITKRSIQFNIYLHREGNVLPELTGAECDLNPANRGSRRIYREGPDVTS